MGVLGDNLFEDPIRPAVDVFRADPTGAMVLLRSVSDPHRFGVAELDGARISRIVEKPETPPSFPAVPGRYLFDRQVFDFIRSLEIPLMITRVLTQGPLPLYGDGLNVGDWAHVSDHCRGIIAAADLGESGRVYNFGGGAERTNRRVIEDVLGMLGEPDYPIIQVRDRAGHDRRYAIDFSRATSDLGWHPLVTFEMGLRGTVQWYSENRAW